MKYYKSIIKLLLKGIGKLQSLYKYSFNFFKEVFQEIISFVKATIKVFIPLMVICILYFLFIFLMTALNNSNFLKTVNQHKSDIVEIIGIVAEGDIGVLGILFSLTAGILTLVGLTSIFVSIDSQQRLQKARELYWEISSLIIKYNSKDYEGLSKNFEEKFFMYKKIMSDSTSKSYTSKIIKLSMNSLRCVIYFWILTPFLLPPTDNKIIQFVAVCTIVVLIILIRFFIFLEGLLDIKKVANLPDPIEFLDGDDGKENALFWLASTSRLIIKRKVRPNGKPTYIA